MTKWATFLYYWLVGRIKTVLQRMPYVSKSFLVLSSGRSGSTLLIQYLRAHPSISCSLAEPLNPESISSHGITDANTNSSTIVNYLMAQLLSWRRYTGCKIFCEQLEFLRLSLVDLLTSLRDPPVIVLYRENMLDTYTSLQLAFKTDVWFSQEESRSCTSVDIDFDDYVHFAETERQRWKDTLAAFPKRRNSRVCLLSYEELIENKEETMARAFSFLRLPPCETVAYSRKQNPYGLEKKIANFEALKGKLETFGGHMLTKEWMNACIAPVYI